MTNIGFYSDEKCTQSLIHFSFEDQYIEVVDVGGLIKVKNVVPIGNTVSKDIYIRNESGYDIGISNILVPDNQLQVKIFENGYLIPNAVFKVNITFTPTKREGIKGNITVAYYEIYK